MSPEQAKGRAADKRSDVWAFGAVFYEMLTGQRPFAGEDISDTLASVLKSEPDWKALPSDVPPHLRMLIERCLTKDRRQRMADISTALFVMSEAASLTSPSLLASWTDCDGGATSTLAPSPRADCGSDLPECHCRHRRLAQDASERRSRHAFRHRPMGPSALVVDSQSRDLTITPDGTHIVYKGNAGSTDTQFFVHRVDQLEPTPLAGGGPAAAGAVLLAGWAMDWLRRAGPHHAQESRDYWRTSPRTVPPRQRKPGRHVG